MSSMCTFHIVLFVIAIHSQMLAMADNLIGVCYGMQGNNLPPPAEVVALYKQYGISKMRLFYPNPSVLEALRDSNIAVALGVRNEDLENIASGQGAAESWFATNVQPYVNNVNFEYIVVGNEVIPGDHARHVGPAMLNLLTILRGHNLQGVKVTTSLSAGVLQTSYPPSASEFKPEAREALLKVFNVLSGQDSSVLMINLYPYFAYATDPSHISLDYAMFTATAPVVRDGSLEYYNLFSAMVDAFYWAMEKLGAPNIGVAVSENGWPSAGNGEFTTPELASKYNKNFVQQIVSKAGTPKRPNTYLDGFLFAMFNENLKPSGVEQHWGLFYPNKDPVYSVFSSK